MIGRQISDTERQYSTLQQVYVLFAKPTTRLMSETRIRWLFWGSVLLLEGIYALVATLPYICYMFIYVPV